MPGISNSNNRHGSYAGGAALAIGNHEACILASIVDDPNMVTETQSECCGERRALCFLSFVSIG